jgi:hypothetical protein
MIIEGCHKRKKKKPRKKRNRKMEGKKKIQIEKSSFRPPTPRSAPQRWSRLQHPDYSIVMKTSSFVLLGYLVVHVLFEKSCEHFLRRVQICGDSGPVLFCFHPL